jgi:drug/metabolite transporter (DMT)-like permease
MATVLAGASLVGAESVLALTPIVIKKTPLDPISAIWSRTVPSAILGWLLTGDRHVQKGELLRSGALGFVNLLHIASSYESFRNLPAGQAMSLLYTYPLWNLVFGALFNGEPVRPLDYGAMAIAVVGAALLNTDPGVAAETGLKGKPQPRWGLLMGLLMALTESGMHTIMRSLGWRDPAKGVWVLSTSATGWLAALTGIQKVVDPDHSHFSGAGTWMDAFWLTVFHSVTMFSGYWLRFFAIPRLSVVTYSILSYAGLLAAYLFGLLFLGERPGWISLLGAVLILGAGAALQIWGGGEENED